MAEPTKIAIEIDDAQMLAELAKIKAKQEEITAATQKYGPEAAKAYKQAEAAALASLRAQAKEQAIFEAAVKKAADTEAKQQAYLSQVRAQSLADEQRAEKAAAAERERQAKYLLDVRLRSLAEEQKAAQRVQDQLARGREADFAIRMDTATEAVKAANGGLNDFKSKVNLSAEALGKASAAAGALGPEFSGIASGAQKAVGALGGVASAMQVVGGPVGLALGAALATLTLAWGKHEEQARKNEEALKAAKEEAQKTASTFDQLAKDLFEATLQQKVLNGTLTQAEADIQRAAHGINETYGPALEGAVNKIDELKVKLAEQQKIIDEAGKSLNNFGGMGSNAGKKIADAKAEQERLNAELGRAEEAYDRLQTSMNNLTDVQTSIVVLTDRQKTATKAATDATKDAAEADREAARAAAEAAAAFQFKIDISKRHIASIDAEGDATEALVRQVEGLGQTEEERIGQTVRDTDAALKAQIAANKELGLSTADLEASRVRLRQWAHDEYEKLAKSEAQARQKADAEATNATLDGIQSIGDAAETIVDSVASVLDEVYSQRVDRAEDLQKDYEQALEDGNDARAKSLKMQMEAEQEGALKAFQVNKGLAISSATLSSIVAVAKALEAGWPAALVTVPAAAAAGAAQIAAAAMQQPPEFDDTNQIRQAVASGTENRVNVSLKNGDLVAAAQTPSGLREQVDRMEGGRGRREIVAERMNRVMAGRTVGSDLDRVTRGIWRTA